MYQPRSLTCVVTCWAVVAFLAPSVAAKTLCVNPAGSGACYSTISAAVSNASPYDVINVEAGTYKEEVAVGIPLSLIGAAPDKSVIDATGLAHGIFVDGFDNPGLRNVTIQNLTVENANFEGILVVSASNINIGDSSILDNDKSPGLSFTGQYQGCPGQPGNGVYENDETGDCGGAIHFIGTSYSTVSGNLITGNADGVLISDETGESHHNLLIHNVIKNNPLECGIVLASHPPTGSVVSPTITPTSPHHGVDHNIVRENLSSDNGVQIGGSGVGFFSDGAGPGRVSGNVVIHNWLIHNGIGGVNLHSHVGPAFGLPPDEMDGNIIVGNFIARNLADTADTATPGTVGININSGDGGSPVYGTVISGNVIRDEQIDIAVNDPGKLDLHYNDLEGGNIGVADVCAYDGSKVCTGSIDATRNYWGCADGPGAHGCTTVSGSDISFVPFLSKPVHPGRK
jgi:Right handed beta helix region